MSFNIESLKSLGEPLKTFNYQIYIPSIPGGGPLSGDDIKFYIDQASLPPIGSEQVSVFSGGHEIRYAGRGIYNHDWTVGMRLYEDNTVLQTLYLWHALQWDRVSGVRNSASVYKETIFLEVLDSNNTVVNQWKIIGAFIANIGEVPLSPDNSNVIVIPVTFGFDYYTNTIG